MNKTKTKQNAEHFFWPGIYVGHKIERTDIPTAPGQQIIMETLALEPRLFYVAGFLTDDEVSKYCIHVCLFMFVCLCLFVFMFV